MALLILDVADDKYDDLAAAMAKRPHIKVVRFDRDARKTFSDCPACHQKLTREAKESTFTINDKLVEAMAVILEKMKTVKTVLLVNKDQSANDIEHIERERCVEVDAGLAAKGIHLGLLACVADGPRMSYYVTAYGIEFVLGERAAAPATIVLLDGKVVESSGELPVQAIKVTGKDMFRVRTDAIVRRAAEAAKSLPEHVKKFVTHGQMSLL